MFFKESIGLSAEDKSSIPGTHVDGGGNGGKGLLNDLIPHNINSLMQEICISYFTNKLVLISLHKQFA